MYITCLVLFNTIQMQLFDANSLMKMNISTKQFKLSSDTLRSISTAQIELKSKLWGVDLYLTFPSSNLQVSQTQWALTTSLAVCFSQS